MLRSLLPLAALALSGCAAHVSEPKAPVIPDSRYSVTFGICTDSQACIGHAPFTLYIHVAAIAGASIACAAIYVRVNGMVSSDIMDCAPGEHEGEGGLVVVPHVFERGSHVLEVVVAEPGRQPIIARRMVVAL